jgi:glutamate racemase
MIGVFDSGAGGLTVHGALIDALPERDFVYLGDNRNAPYGAKPPIDVLDLTCAALERLCAALSQFSRPAARWRQAAGA